MMICGSSPATSLEVLEHLDKQVVIAQYGMAHGGRFQPRNTESNQGLMEIQRHWS